MDVNDEDSSSDVEIINPSLLRNSYFQQQVRLIYEIQEVKKQIPKDWELFKNFIIEKIQWNPPMHLMRTVWKKMILAENVVTGNNLPQQIIELSDDDESDDCLLVAEEQVIPIESILGNGKGRGRRKGSLSKPTAVIEPLCQKEVPWKRSKVPGPKGSDQSPGPDMPIDVINQPNGVVCSRLCNEPIDENKIQEKPLSKPKTTRKRKQKQPLSEEEANAIRERLLIDKLIELELPKVLQSLMSNFSADCPDINIPFKFPRKRISKRKQSNTVE